MPEGGWPEQHCLRACRFRSVEVVSPPRVLLLETPHTHKDFYNQLAGDYTARNGHMARVVWEPGKPLWNIPALVEEHRPDVVLRWEEHGGLFVNREWVKACEWCYKQGIMPALLDWGYFAHYKSIYIGYYTRDGKPDIVDIWDDLSPHPRWELADTAVAEWRRTWLVEWGRADVLGPVPGTEPGYVLIWVQYSANGSRIHGWTGADWCEKTAAVIRDAGLVPVFKLPPKPGKMPVPDGEITFPSRSEHKSLNHRLVRYAAHSVAITTTATNGCILVGAPVVSCGDQWCSGFGVWHDTTDPADFARIPKVDETARGKWSSYWLQRQFQHQDMAPAVHRLHAEWQGRYLPPPLPAVMKGSDVSAQSAKSADTPHRRAVYLIGRGLGNMLMAVPAMKALADRAGTAVEVASAKPITAGFLDLLKGERWVKCVRRTPPATDGDMIVGAAALNYPPEIARQKYGEGAVIAEDVRFMHKHESEQDAQIARSLGLTDPLPTGRIHADPPPGDLPAQYIAVGMECAWRWTQGRKRMWPHWERFARVWGDKSEIALVFLGTRSESWARECGIDRLGTTPDLRTAAAIIAAADAFVGIDCGLSHVAGAVGTPALVLYGPTTSYHTGPYYGGLTAIDGRHPCRACFGETEWATCKGPRCMSSIRPEKVADALDRILWRRGRPLEAETGRERMRGRWYHTLRPDRRPSQWPQELEALWPMIAEIQPRTMMEIGVKRGGWLYTMAAACRPGAHLLGVELHARQLRKNGLEAALLQEGYRVDIVRGDSHEPGTQEAVRGALDGEPVDVLHIDGDHAKASALADWKDYRPLVRSGGLVIMHDAFKPNEGVEAALLDIQAEEGPKVVYWRWINRWRKGGSRGPGIAIAEIA